MKIIKVLYFGIMHVISFTFTTIALLGVVAFFLYLPFAVFGAVLILASYIFGTPSETQNLIAEVLPFAIPCVGGGLLGIMLYIIPDEDVTRKKYESVLKYVGRD